jgi:lipid A ethanolaminephosphotransferase
VTTDVQPHPHSRSWSSPSGTAGFGLSANGLVFIAALYFALTNRPFLAQILEGRSPASLSTWIFALSTGTLLLAGHYIFLLPFSAHRTIRPVLTVLLILNAAAIHFLSRFRIYLDGSMLRNILETDAREATELMSWSLGGSVIVYGVIPAVLAWLVPLRREPLAAAVRRRLATALGLTIAALLLALLTFKTSVSFFRNHPQARYLITPENYVSSAVRVLLDGGNRTPNRREIIGADARKGTSWREAKRPLLFVLVVGETARASSFALDGYWRDTNPQLAARDVISFSHVESCGTATAESLPCMFSMFSRAEFTAAKGKRYESLLDVARRAGLTVTWIDNNSGCKGVCSGVDTLTVEPSRHAGRCPGGECFDSVLIDELRKLIDGAPRDRLVVLHQKGSHGPAYFRRYPPAFDRFQPSCHSPDLDQCSDVEIRNAYDNSILYTDSVLASLIDLLDARKELDTALLYVSDHGESTGENGIYLHGLPYVIAPESQKRVPMIAWLSDEFATRAGIDRDGLRRVSSSPLSHDHLFHSLLGALDIRTSLYREELDFFASANR